MPPAAFWIVLVVSPWCVACKASSPAAQTHAPISSAQPGALTLQLRTGDGKHLLLGDGSTWRVQPIGQGQSIRWRAGDAMEPRRVNHPVYPWLLVNHRAQDAVLARPERPPGPLPVLTRPQLQQQAAHPVSLYQ